MSKGKQKQLSTSTTQSTRSATTAAKIAANMAAACPVTKGDLEALLSKQSDSFKSDMAKLLKESTDSLERSVNSLGQQVASFNSRLDKIEVVVGENFEKLNLMEATVQSLQSQTITLQDRVDDLENRSRRSNLRIINIPEGRERGQDPIKFVSDLIMEVTGPGVLSSPPEIERAHRSLGPRPGDSNNTGKPRAFIVKFLRFQEKEAVLRWARQHKLDYGGTELRVYPDISSVLAKKRAAFIPIKNSLYQKGIQFRLLHPARLHVSFRNDDYYFDCPQKAQDFYIQRIVPPE
ncbi:hypothetical protein KUCAC02_013605 [Chaenocephalus aceratus]|uniref:Uncharacterized protein n=1 Tax=Chaenocephalus aceratus TaxID=36190 RepID=A0ACB9WBC6_CHAAC|nr:hypothetical protein KUCAC02_013605 [Chaenocephalus aceratus]